MTWVMGLTTGPGGFGSAFQIAGGQAHLLGVFPTAARAVSAASLAALDEPPAHIVLVHPSGMPAHELGQRIGELAAAGLATADIELRSDVEVLVAVTGNRVLLIDADRDLIAGHPGKIAPFDAYGLAELVAKDPFATTVALTGHPELRDRYHVAARDYAPMLVERPALAALALDNPTTSVLVSTPRSAETYTRGSKTAVPYLFITSVLVVAMVLIFVILVL